VDVSEPGDGNGRGAEAGTERPPIEPETPPEGAGVLANLPRTRPQRATARRTAARSANAAKETTSANGNGRAPRTSPRKPSAPSAKRASPAKPSRPKAARAKPARKRPVEDVPRQGYESVEERATGPVQPPGGTELVGTAAEIVNEIAKAGISGGERLLRDVLSRLGR
jgi:hypothetical protein